MFGMICACFRTLMVNTAQIRHFLVFQTIAMENNNFSTFLCWIQHVNQNSVCRFFCVCRTDMNHSAFDSPDPGECFKYTYHGSATHRKFFTRPQSLGGQLFSPTSTTDEKFLRCKIFTKKVWDVKMTFFKNVFKSFLMCQEW